MKKIYLLGSFLSFCSLLTAQNAFFLTFGTSTDEVLEVLGEKDYLKYMEFSGMRDTLTVEGKYEEKINYLFEKGVLYQVIDNRTYFDSKETDRVVKVVLEYFKMREGKVTSISSHEGDKYFCILEDRLITMVVSGDRKADLMHISILSTSRSFGPKVQTEEYIARVSNY